MKVACRGAGSERTIRKSLTAGRRQRVVRDVEEQGGPFWVRGVIDPQIIATYSFVDQ